MCLRLKGLNRKQVRVCKRHVELMSSVKKGAEMAIQECQHQFKYRKWNCTTINNENEPVFGNALNKGEIVCLVLTGKCSLISCHARNEFEKN